METIRQQTMLWRRRSQMWVDCTSSEIVTSSCLYCSLEIPSVWMVVSAASHA